MNGNILLGQELGVQGRTSLAKGLQKQARLEQINNLQKICLLRQLEFELNIAITLLFNLIFSKYANDFSADTKCLLYKLCLD